MSEAKGVKETQEAIIALVVLGKVVAERMKDGLQLDDALAIGQKFADESFKNVVMAGVQGIDQVPAEIKDINLAEVLELAKVIPQVLEIIQAK